MLDICKNVCYNNEVLLRKKYKNAPVAELADALDLGSSVPDVKVQVLSGAPQTKTLIGFSYKCFCFVWNVFYCRFTGDLPWNSI